jgi:iron(III) transport system permease protein
MAAMRFCRAFSLAAFTLLCWAPFAGWLTHWQWWLPSGRQSQVLLTTLLYSFAVATLAALLGASAALACWRNSSLAARTAPWIALIAAPFPPYLHSLAWLPLFASFPQRGMGWPATIWVQTLAILPFSFGIVRLALNSLNPALIEAARLSAPDSRLLRRVLIPALHPALLAAFSLTLLLTLSDPAAPSLFAQSSYALEIFADFSATHDAARAMAMSAPLVLAGLLALVPLHRYWQAAAHRPAASTTLAPLHLPLLSPAPWLLFLPILALVLALARTAGSPQSWQDSLLTGWPGLRTSFASAWLAALCALPLAFCLNPRSPLAWWFFTAPLAAPGALTGAGLIWLWNRDLPFTPYATFWLLPLAALARFLPLAILTLAAWRTRLDPLLLEAASLNGPPARTFWRIELPLLLPGLTAAAALVFALSLTELAATLLIVPPGAGTLAIRIYNYLHYGASASVAALSLCLIAGVATSAWLAARLWRLLP